MDLYEPRVGHERFHGGNGWIESLALSHGQDDVGSLCRVNEVVGLHKGPCDRLFHQYGDASLEKWQCDKAVHVGRHGNRHRVDVVHDLTRIEHRTGAGCGGDLLGAVTVGIDYGDEVRAR